jgi:molybdopterin-containing oxidoreductase family iron-sulfur binding subunit
MDRREFLGLLTLASGASLLAGCDLTRKSEKLIPYLVPPDDGIVPGQATFVNTSCTECPANCGMTARIRDQRPVRVDGTAGHPINDGALCVRGQASLSRLYHVDRLRQPMVKDPAGKLVPGTWGDALKRSSEALRAAGNKVLLSKRTTGSLSALMDDFASRTGVERAPEYELFSNASIVEANRSLFGAAVVPLLHPERADVMITVGADVLETFGNPVQFTVSLSKRRGNSERVNWYHAEPHASLTGFKSDHRLIVKPGSEAVLLAYLLHTVAQTRGAGSVAAHVQDVPAVDLARAATATGLAPDVLSSLGNALINAKSPLVAAGGVSTGQASGLDTARLAALLQSACGMHGRTVDIAQAQDYSRVGTLSDIERLVQRLDGGSIGTLIVFNTDPVSQLPNGAAFAQSLDHAGFVIGVGDIMTDTMQRADVVLPLSHALESWGDAEPAIGIVNAIQPTFAPLFDTASDGDVLLRLMIEMGAAAAGTTYQQYVSDRWAKEIGPGTPATLLQQGWMAYGDAAANPAAKAPDHKYTFDSAAAHAGAVLVVAPSPRWYDGRSAELPLLHEIPDPISSVTWDSWFSAGPETATALGASEEDEVELKGEGWSLALPIRIQPGLARDVYVVHRGAAITPALGWSRLSGEAGTVADVAASRTGQRTRIAKTSGSLTEAGRGIVPGSEPHHFNGPHAEEKVDTAHPNEERDKFTFYPVPKYPNYRWSMAIDLDKCTGCSACVAACYIENNVPMTGRDAHLRGREMAWIRLEQYYEMDGSAASFVPAMCQHCDYAPCEPVCPVYATYHNDEGLNAQVYNRCVGTRYCSNNCPYKQRRFNWFSWEHRQHPLDLMTNPDVSMRGKGIMEKCTMCVQRIRHARDVAKDEGRKIQDGEFTTACAQACPGKAIVFGNLLDENSEVHKWAHDPRSTRMLEELGTSPGVFYLKKNGGAEHGA